MPSLSDRINANQKTLTRDANGQLSEETQESVQDLSKKAGIAPPITPMGQAAIGASPEQTKMAGTPQQKNAALNLANNATQDQTLGTAQRQQQSRTQATGQEQGKIQQSQDMQNLGQLGQRVTDFINAQKTNLQNAAGTATTQVADTVSGAGSSTLPPDKAAAAKPLLAQLAQDPSNMQLMLQVNQTLGYDINTQLSPDQINNLYQDATTTISKGGADAVANGLTVNDLINQGNFQYNPQQLSQLLGVPQDQVTGMTVQQIHDKISEIQANEFSQTNQLEQKAQSGQLGTAERALARQGAREASSTGVRASEADVSHLNQQIQNADQVQFAGRTMSVEDLLKDDTISGVITSYLNAAPGSPERTKLEQTEPQLLQFIQKNQAVLQDAAQHLSTGAQQFQDIQTSNKALREGVDPNLAQALLGDSTLQASKTDTTSNPLLNTLQTNPNAKNILTNVTQEDAQQLKGLNQDQVTSLLNNGGVNWRNYQEDKQKAQDASQRIQVAANTGNPDDVINQIFGGQYGGGYKQFQTDYAQEQTANMLGLPNNASAYSKLGGTSGSTRDSAPTPQQLATAYSSQLGQPSLTDELQGKRANTGGLPVPSAKLDVNNLDDNQSSIWKKLGSAVDNDGQVDYNELSKSGLSFDQLDSINPSAPAFKGQPVALAHAMADAYGQEDMPPPDVSAAQMGAAYNAMLKERDTLSQRIQDTGHASDIVSALSGPLAKLSDMLSKQTAKEAAEKKAADDKAIAQMKADANKTKVLGATITPAPTTKVAGATIKASQAQTPAQASKKVKF